MSTNSRHRLLDTEACLASLCSLKPVFSNSINLTSNLFNLKAHVTQLSEFIIPWGAILILNSMPRDDLDVPGDFNM